MKYVRWVDLDPIVEELYDLEKDPMEINNIINDSNYKNKLGDLKTLFQNWREIYPQEISYRPYQQYSQSGVKEMDWKKFKAFRPKQYEKIKLEVEKLGATWEQAVKDKDIRFKISRNAGYWY